MAKKNKQIVWHKKRGRFISSNVLAPPAHSVPPKDTASNPQDRSVFKERLAQMIKKAVRESRKH